MAAPSRCGRSTRRMAEAPTTSDHNSVDRVVDHLFRHTAGDIVAVLTRIFGIDRLAMVEDVVQDALIAALKNWPYNGIPDNPGGWLITAARNRALDLIRREKSLAEKQPDIARQLYHSLQDTISDRDPHGLADDQLRLMFACCHPSLPADSRVMIVLKLLCGFSVAEIARAFLSSEAAVAQRIVRAKRTLREHDEQFMNLEHKEITSRLDSVLQALYLMFNEGYSVTEGENLVRFDLVGEALRLSAAVAAHEAGARPDVFALIALMSLQAARLPARVDADGNLVLLADQDRARWDRQLIARGMHYLERAADGERVTRYHLEAGIAACHMAAPSYEKTDWEQILAYYELLAQQDSSPVIMLNRAVAVAELRGAERGLEELDRLAGEPKLEGYYLYHATRAELLTRLGQSTNALDSYRTALSLTGSAPERRFLEQRIADHTA
ncbi:sigma-70 family RNA polymerase sigma factor [candidate division GN15 bacterium]|nr:sigma-70 family RNA polymerase sigma factor [candidate division GN15 bacterium]